MAPSTVFWTSQILIRIPLSNLSPNLKTTIKAFLESSENNDFK